MGTLKPPSEDLPTNDMKYDSQAVPVHLLPVFPLYAAARVFEFGANNKYAPNSWRDPSKKPVPLYRTIGSVMRHLFARMAGEVYDSQSGKPHTWHALTQCMILVEHEAMEADGAEELMSVGLSPKRFDEIDKSLNDANA